MHLNGRRQEAEWINGGNDYLMELLHSVKHTGSPREAERDWKGNLFKSTTLQLPSHNVLLAVPKWGIVSKAEIEWSNLSFSIPWWKENKHNLKNIKNSKRHSPTHTHIYSTLWIFMYFMHMWIYILSVILSIGLYIC